MHAHMIPRKCTDIQVTEVWSWVILLSTRCGSQQTSSLLCIRPILSPSVFCASKSSCSTFTARKQNKKTVFVSLGGNIRSQCHNKAQYYWLWASSEVGEDGVGVNCTSKCQWQGGGGDQRVPWVRQANCTSAPVNAVLLNKTNKIIRKKGKLLPKEACNMFGTEEQEHANVPLFPKCWCSSVSSNCAHHHYY